jgi:AraC-like DNA-binding protein
MYFDTLLSSCDRQLFKAYLPDTEKTVYDFRPVPVPPPVYAFLEQMLDFQKQKVDCIHFNNLKHCELFILLRRFCPRADIVAFLFPLISHSMNFRNKVLEKFSGLEGGRVTEFADLVGMGRKNFDKRFREEFGTSPAKWIQQETAKRLRLYLAEPEITISDAMDKFHFNSPSHFNRFCRRYFNKSPGVMIKDAQDLKAKKAKKK